MPINETEEFEFALALEKQGASLTRAEKPIPASVSGEEPGLQGGGGFQFLEDLSKKLGSSAAEVTGGAKPWEHPVAAGLAGAAAETATTFLPIPGAAVNRGSEGIKAVGSKAGQLLGHGVETLRGTAIPGAKTAATDAAKAASESGAAAHLDASKMGSELAENLAKEKAALSAQKAASAPDLGTQGGHMRDAVSSAVEKFKGERSATADIQFKAAKTSAAAKEASGARVDTSTVRKPLEELAELAKGTRIEPMVRKMLESIGEPGIQQIKSSILSTKGAPIVSPGAPTDKTFAMLEIVRRDLNDIAYSGPLEGYGSIVKKAALDASHELDKTLQAFVPEFKTYKDTYRKLSEPLDSMNTRFGRAIHATEGGLSGDIYAKLSEQDLPGKLFSKREGRELLVDALAGGINAPAKARKAAEKQVDDMVENWLVKSIEGKTSEQAIKHVTSPQMEATLKGSPAAKKVVKGIGKTAEREAKIKALDDFSSKVVAKAQEHAKNAAEIRSEISRADKIAQGGSDDAKKEAFGIYKSVMKQARDSGQFESDKYKAAIELIDRAATLEEKTSRARKLAGVLGGLGLVATEETVRRSFF